MGCRVFRLVLIVEGWGGVLRYATLIVGNV